MIVHYLNLALPRKALLFTSAGAVQPRARGAGNKAERARPRKKNGECARQMAAKPTVKPVKRALVSLARGWSRHIQQCQISSVMLHAACT
eukprot:4822194-Prymnesium_polylepis.2